MTANVNGWHMLPDVVIVLQYRLALPASWPFLQDLGPLKLIWDNNPKC